MKKYMINHGGYCPHVSYKYGKMQYAAYDGYDLRGTPQYTGEIKECIVNHPVQSGLALTPAQVDKMARDGMPVELGSDTTFAPSEILGDTFDVSAAHERGATLASVWQAEQDSRKSVGSAVKRLVDLGNEGIGEQ